MYTNDNKLTIKCRISLYFYRPSELPIVNKFCAKNGGYTLIKDGETSNDFVKCKEKLQ